MQDIMNELSLQGVVFRTKDLNDQGISNYQITKLVDDGTLIKLYQGVYSLEDIGNIKITDINVIIENGILSLSSAAYLYKLTSGESGKITITLNREQKPPRLPFDLFCYYYTSSKFYDVGLKIIDQNGRKIKIYDIERTVCDMIRHRSKYDSNIIREVIENYLMREERNMDKLYEYAKELRVYNVLVQYLEILGGMNGKKE